MQNQSEPEKPVTPEQSTLTPKAKGQLTVLNAFLDRLPNITAIPEGNISMRKRGYPNLPTSEQDLADLLSELQKLNLNSSAAAARLARGETLVEINALKKQFVDLKNTDYTDLSGPPVPRKTT